MSTPTGYHQPVEQDEPYGDHDSDIDIDVQELDPQSSSVPKSSASTQANDYAKRIPLRNLRFGGRRRPQRDDHDDLEALTGAREEREGLDVLRPERQSAGSSTFGGDDAPLLHSAYAERRPSQISFLQHLDARSPRWIWKCIPFAAPSSGLAAAMGPPEPEDEHDPSTQRTVSVGQRQPARFPANIVSNAKYTAYSFLPRTLYNEFKYFLNMYFLLVAMSQIIPQLRIGYLSTYVVPLAFVMSITLGKEAYDDLNRRRRDNEANSEPYKILMFNEIGSGATGAGGRSKRNIKTLTERKRDKRRRPTNQEEGMRDSEDVPSSMVTEVFKPSRDLKVGDVLVLEKDSRVPADVVILKSFNPEPSSPDSDETPQLQGNDELVDLGGDASAADEALDNEAVAGLALDNDTATSEPSGGGEAFIRTDQLDGETDWKLRLASPLSQTLSTSEYMRLQVVAGKPDRRVNEFVGTIELLPKQSTSYDPPVTDILQSAQQNGHLRKSKTEPPRSVKSFPLTIDNTAWANTVLASSTTVHAVVVYTGPQTRAALSTSEPRSKVGLLELEINSLTKILCLLTAGLCFLLVAFEGFSSRGGYTWYIDVMRFLVLFSTIVPISLRVNLDLGKSVFAWYIHHDTGIPGTIVRTSTIPEDLGRIEYLLSDKTGTLTRNEMELRKVHVGTVSYGGEAMEEIGGYLKQAFALSEGQNASVLFTPSAGLSMSTGTTRTRREIGLRVRNLVLALALCHNVTPTIEEDDTGQAVTAYQASSPDEIAIVQWTEHVGLKLAHRDRKNISLQFAPDGRTVVRVDILNLFPFTSESKRMGIVVRFIRRTGAEKDEDGEIVFFQKGADTVMTSIVAANDWLDEETANMAREGLRTLVIGRKTLSREQYSAFATAYSEASLELVGRDAAMATAVKQHLEHDLELLGVTGVEDKLQPQVKPSLELLRNGGVKIWMLTGDKVETARCIAVSSKLVSRGQHIHTIAGLKKKELALDALSVLQSRPNAALLIDGESLALYLQHHRHAFISLAVRLPAVIACRCSPTQKADVARLIRAFTRKRIACIGDGGNDVSMIQAADVGVGIVGKEGRQASLAADFSITQFAHLTKLLVWHGRNSYKRSAKLAQFVIHRGLIISVCQTVFSVADHFEPTALYRDWLLVGYATVYTMAPVFSLVLDKDVDEDLANLYPELYKELTLGRSLSYKTFFIWLGISIYQGLIIQGGSELLVPGFHTDIANSSTQEQLQQSIGFKRMVAVSFTVLVVNELVMVAAEITTWHPVMIFSILGTALVYFGSMPFLGDYLELSFLVSLGFWWRFAAISAASLVPVYAGKVIRTAVRPPSYRKVRGV